MNDLRSLFGSTDTQGFSANSSSESRNDPAALRTLVGGASVRSSEPREPALADLRVLVGAVDDSSETAASADLHSLVGGPAPSRDENRPRPSADPEPGSSGRRVPTSAALTALVGDSPGRAADEGWLAPELAQAGRRPIFGGRRRAGAVNYFSVAAAAVAVLALVGTASFAVVQRATANPADDAMVSLREREAELANETNVLQTAADLYSATVEEASTLAESSGPVLAALQGRMDGTVLGAAEASRSTLAAAAAGASPVTVPVYSRGSIDEESLPEVAKAIDGVRLASEGIPALLSKAREARAGVVGALAEYRTQLASLGTAIQAEAAKIVVANDSAGDSFRSAVTDAAAGIVNAQRAGGDGLAEMPAYAAAVDALRTENARILALEEAERNAAPTTPRTPSGGTNSGGSSNGSGGTNPGGSPGAGNTPSPEPSQPSPEPQPEPEPDPEPQPSQPADPDPVPTSIIPSANA